jgi:hypothetical protein
MIEAYWLLSTLSQGMKRKDVVPAIEKRAAIKGSIYMSVGSTA